MEVLKHGLVDGEGYYPEFARLNKEQMLFALNLYYVVYVDIHKQSLIISDENFYCRYDYHDLNELDDMTIQNALYEYSNITGTKVYHSVFDLMQISVLFKRLQWFFSSLGGVTVEENKLKLHNQKYYYVGKDGTVWFTDWRSLSDKALQFELKNDNISLKKDVGVYNPFDCEYVIIRKE